jgi:hypothetical protein
MKIIKFFFALMVILQFNLIANAQSNILEKIKSIKVMSSTRADVEKLLGKGKDQGIWSKYRYEKEFVEITYSDGTCTRGFLAPKDTVIEVSLDFREERKLSELKKKVNLKKLRMERSYDTADKVYFDDELGIAYEANEVYKFWSSITFYPSKSYSGFACKD